MGASLVSSTDTDGRCGYRRHRYRLPRKVAIRGDHAVRTVNPLDGEDRLCDCFDHALGVRYADFAMIGNDTDLLDNMRSDQVRLLVYTAC